MIKTFFNLALIFSFCVSAFAQTIQVSGTVTDSGTGVPIPGVNVSVGGTNTGVVTDFDGNYEIAVAQDGMLIFSYVGFESQEISVDGRTSISISLKSSTSELDEVVLVGYGTQKKSDLVGAISSVKGDELVLSTAPSVGQVLQGRAAGLQITQNSAQPGGGLDIVIRGAASINASNQPLVVVDGFPLDENNFGQPSNGNRYSGGTQGILNSFNPNDIESIEVLKDASATAIYGARAANGVILITTKKGVEGDVQVSYSGSYSYQAYNDEDYDVFKLKEWKQLRNEAAFENWAFQNRVFPYSDRTLEEAIADPVNGVEFRRYYSDENIRNSGPGTDWLGLVTRDGGIQQHNLSLRGGSAKTKYFLSGNIFENKGIIKKSAFDRVSLRFNLDQEVNDYLKLGLNLTKSKINNNNSQLSTRELSQSGIDGFENSGIIRAAIQQGPQIEAIDEDGNYPLNPDSAVEPNPFSLLNITDQGTVDRTLANFYLELKPIDQILFRAQYGVDQGFSDRRSYLPTSIYAGALENGRADIANQKKNDDLVDLTLTYDDIYADKHQLTVLLGFSRQKFRSEGSSATASNFITDAFLANNLGTGANRPIVSSFNGEYGFISYFTRLNYIFDDKYIFTGTLRRDGASVFAENNRYGFFPSAAIGWKISEESFMEPLRETLSQLKLRVSYGETGNSSGLTGNAFAALRAGPAYLGPDESVLTGVFPFRLANPDLKWETTTETNLGLDFGLWNNRVYGSLEFYYREVSDLLQSKPINSYNAVGQVLANVGTTEGKGFEFTLNSNNISTQNFKWKSIFTFSTYKNNWKERAPDFKPAVYQSDTDPIRARYSYIADGIMQVGEEVPAQPDLFPGMIKIKDLNGFERDDAGNPAVDENGRFLRTGAPDGIIDEADIVLLGSTDPDVTAGLANIITYKNFELNLQFNGMFGRQITDLTDFSYGVSAYGVAVNGRNALRSVNERWTPENPSTTRPASHFGFSRYGSGDFFLQDAWFIRLQYASLSYRLPQEWFGNLLNSAALRLDGTNLFVITPYKGIDPETDAYTAAYPNVRTFTLGLDIKF